MSAGRIARIRGVHETYGVFRRDYSWTIEGENDTVMEIVVMTGNVVLWPVVERNGAGISYHSLRSVGALSPEERTDQGVIDVVYTVLLQYNLIDPIAILAED